MTDDYFRWNFVNTYYSVVPDTMMNLLLKFIYLIDVLPEHVILNFPHFVNSLGKFQCIIYMAIKRKYEVNYKTRKARWDIFQVFRGFFFSPEDKHGAVTSADVGVRITPPHLEIKDPENIQLGVFVACVVRTINCSNLGSCIVNPPIYYALAHNRALVESTIRFRRTCIFREVGSTACFKFCSNCP